MLRPDVRAGHVALLTGQATGRGRAIARVDRERGIALVALPELMS